MIFRIILSIAGFLLVAEGIVAASISNLNLGIVMPFVIGIPLIVVGVFYPLLSSWWSVSIVGKILKYAMISAYVLFALLFAATTTLILANSKTTAEPEKADVLIVLGAGIRGDLPSVVLRNRLDRALDCYEQNPDLLIIVSGGMGEGESSTEASVMKKWLVAAGVPADSIIEEGKSQSTEGNFIFSFDIINRLFDGSGAAAESNPRVAFVNPLPCVPRFPHCKKTRIRCERRISKGFFSAYREQLSARVCGDYTVLLHRKNITG